MASRTGPDGQPRERVGLAPFIAVILVVAALVVLAILMLRSDASHQMENARRQKEANTATASEGLDEDGRLLEETLHLGNRRR